MKDISVAFCFICLLHLANEEGLSIKPETTGEVNGMSELIVQQEA